LPLITGEPKKRKHKKSFWLVLFFRYN
jgi:hypothetical protein